MFNIVNVNDVFTNMSEDHHRGISANLNGVKSKVKKPNRAETKLNKNKYS